MLTFASGYNPHTTHGDGETGNGLGDGMFNASMPFLAFTDGGGYGYGYGYSLSHGDGKGGGHAAPEGRVFVFACTDTHDLVACVINSTIEADHEHQLR
jgi:hypothetical protein